MKRALIGGFTALLGTIWGLAVLTAASNNLVNSWGKYGRLATTVVEMGLTVPLALSVAFVLLGVGIMAVEYFRKD